MKTVKISKYLKTKNIQKPHEPNTPTPAKTHHKTLETDRTKAAWQADTKTWETQKCKGEERVVIKSLQVPASDMLG